jgi:hypothetical protein
MQAILVSHILRAIVVTALLLSQTAMLMGSISDCFRKILGPQKRTNIRSTINKDPRARAKEMEV